MATSEEKPGNDDIMIAVQGCCHGELDKIYETLQYIEKTKSLKIDILLCCGDFQAIRNQKDLESMAVPPKYRKMGIFHQYYNGTKKAPVLTIFIGGNHEAATHLWELPFGGWVAPNIYYLGYAGVVEFAGLKIGGISGIYKAHDYFKGHFEMPVFNEGTKRSFYHTRNYEVFKLKVLSERLDVFLSHDWPKYIYNHGDVDSLLQKKTFFKKEIEENTLGSPACKELLNKLKPLYWFAAHLHVKFPAIVEHEGTNGKHQTKFLALDKCLPYRDFLQILNMGPATAPKELRYNAEWLGITKLTYQLYNATPRATWLPVDEVEYMKYRGSEELLVEIMEKFPDELRVPSNFQNMQRYQSKTENLNNQTVEFCEKLGIENPCNLTIIRKIESFGKRQGGGMISNNDSSSSDEFEEIPKITRNPNEISLDDSSDDNDSDDDDSNEISSSSFSKSSDIDSSNDNQSDLKRKLSSEEQSDISISPQKPTFLVRRNKALYASLDDDNSGSSSSDCL
eukprot:gene5268-5934_t